MKDEHATEIEELESIFELQKTHYSPANHPSYETRMGRLSRIEQLCKENIGRITDVLQQDFGSRNPDITFLSDIYSPLFHARKTRRHLKAWMKKKRTSSGLLALTGQRTYIVNEPLGVVGVMSPFNAPVSLALDPAIAAIAAGNSVMIKFSENTPRIAELMRSLATDYFRADELSVVAGGYDVSRAFAALPWDKLVFTGGTEVGKSILAATANSLTPVILELGGKSPCVILDDADISEAARKIGKVRQMNGGQVCIAGDYVLLPERHLTEFVEAVTEGDRLSYPTIVENEEFTSIIHDGAYDRITGYINEAREAGCKIVQVNPMNEKVPNRAVRKIPLTIIVNPSDDLMVSMNEVFGPIIAVYTYDDLDDAIARINGREKPLAVYVFGRNRKGLDKVINNTSSGGVTVNDLLLHAGSETMGFGGVGSSGMGRYKGGSIGYEAFSNPKSVFEQGIMGRFTEKFLPPLKSDLMRRMLRRRVGLK